VCLEFKDITERLLEWLATRSREVCAAAIRSAAGPPPASERLARAVSSDTV
jgi:hypothetical protein